VRYRAGLYLGLVLLISSCGYGSSDDTAMTDTTTAETPEAEIKSTFTSIHTHVLAKSCAISGCHVSGGQSPSMELSVAYDNLVDQLSSEATGMKFITPNDPTESYLIHKLEGTQSDVGGSGLQMPRGKTALSEATITKIKEWITNGAENN
jgi:hypothetical protein